jgi:hypothetical protein
VHQALMALDQIGEGILVVLVHETFEQLPIGEVAALVSREPDFPAMNGGLQRALGHGRLLRGRYSLPLLMR